MVFVVTGLLTVAGMVFFLLIEWSNPATLGPLSFWQKAQAALFQSVTLRTAGYATVNQAALMEISQFFSCLLMLVGGSSASAAGGIKTVTAGVIVFSMLSLLKGRNRVEAFGRTLPLDLLQKALTVTCAMLAVVLSSTVVLHFTEQGSSFP
jgi:trk system potassium uptake protein TrkH